MRCRRASRAKFTDFANPLLTRISVSPNITNGDCNTFNLPARKDASERPSISDKPLVGLVAKGGGTVQVVVRIESDGSKASMHPDADLIEMRHVLLGVDVAAPTSVRELTDMTISSRGRSELKLGDGAISRILYLVARYVNKVDASKNGPWSTMQRQVVA